MKEIIKDIKENMEKDINSYKDKASKKVEIDFTSGDIYKANSNKSLLNPEIFEYLELRARGYRKNESLVLDYIFPTDMEEKEKEEIHRLMRFHYAISYRMMQKEIIKTRILAGIILGFGALLYALFGLLVHFNVSFIYQGIAEIFSWVFIWEACHLFFFTNNENKIKSVNYLRLYKAVLDKKTNS